MYSLLVSHQVEDELISTIEFEKGRFLEYTSDAISEQLKNLSSDAIDWIKSWPCVLMQEGRAEEVAHIVQIENLQAAARSISLKVHPIPSRKLLVNDELWKLRTELDIGQFEFNRNHWAIKDRDLFAILAKDGYRFRDAEVARFGNKKISVPTRRELLEAKKVVALLSHTEIDDFCVEIGISDVKAGRELGSRRERANAIVEYALAYPAATTAENSLLSVFIIRIAANHHDPSSNTEILAPDLSIASPSVATKIKNASDDRTPNRVFVVHGQNEAARSALIKMLTTVGLEPIVLHEQPNMGRHLLTKFIEEAELVTFAIVAMTDDDMGGREEGKLFPRARQNVILELGYFLSHLGQERVCALITPGLETPSDFDGIVYIKMDSAGNWEKELLRELRAAKMPLVE